MQKDKALGHQIYAIIGFSHLSRPARLRSSTTKTKSMMSSLWPLYPSIRLSPRHFNSMLAQVLLRDEGIKSSKTLILNKHFLAESIISTNLQQVIQHIQQKSNETTQTSRQLSGCLARDFVNSPWPCLSFWPPDLSWDRRSGRLRLVWKKLKWNMNRISSKSKMKTMEIRAKEISQNHCMRTPHILISKMKACV